MPGMDGMMSEEDMAALQNAQGVEASKLYLTQMIKHHQGAITMAQNEIKDGQYPARDRDGALDRHQPAAGDRHHEQDPGLAVASQSSERVDQSASADVSRRLGMTSDRLGTSTVEVAVGNVDGEGAAQAGSAAGCGDAAAVGLGEGLGDGEPDPSAAVASVAGSVGAVEAFEHVREVLGGDAVAAVGDR